MPTVAAQGGVLSVDFLLVLKSERPIHAYGGAKLLSLQSFSWAAYLDMQLVHCTVRLLNRAA
jgi:hypothetical protein